MGDVAAGPAIVALDKSIVCSLHFLEEGGVQLAQALRSLIRVDRQGNGSVSIVNLAPRGGLAEPEHCLWGVAVLDLQIQRVKWGALRHDVCFVWCAEFRWLCSRLKVVDVGKFAGLQVRDECL